MAIALLLAAFHFVPEASAAPPWVSDTVTNFADEFNGAALNTNALGTNANFKLQIRLQ